MRLWDLYLKIAHDNYCKEMPQVFSKNHYNEVSQRNAPLYGEK